MALRLTLVCQNNRMDLQVNREQKIIETLEILEDSGKFSFLENADKQIVHSVRTRERVNTRLTYEQAQIYTGDILEMEMQENEKINLQGEQ